MNNSRPTIEAQILAQIIDGTPDRIRRRLDRDPSIAETWDWKEIESGWQVKTGSETVVIEKQQIDSIDWIRCSCLLSPKCFHTLACLSILKSKSMDHESTPSSANEEPITAACELPAARYNTNHAADQLFEWVEPDELQISAAREFRASLNQILGVGVLATGVSVQSGLLRAVHQCRTRGLHRLAAGGLSVLEGIRLVRQKQSNADPIQLATDISNCLETIHHIVGGESIPDYWIGTSRRKQYAIRPKRIHGLFAEPVLTLSGYSGVAVYFLGEDSRIYTAVEVRPGAADHCRSAYRGGVEIGPVVLPAIQLSRHRYQCGNASASTDGRLGKGKSVEIAEIGKSDWNHPIIKSRFTEALDSQRERIASVAELPAEAQPAGWDLVFLTGALRGALGPDLIMQLSDSDQTIRLAIPIDDKELFYRDNLALLCRTVGMEINLIGRYSPSSNQHNTGLTVQAIALSQSNSGLVADLKVSKDENSKEPIPSLVLPESWGSRVCLGLDKIKRPYLLNSQSNPVIFDAFKQIENPSQLGVLRRRWVAWTMGGLLSQLRTSNQSVNSDIATLSASGFQTAASLLDSIARRQGNLLDTFLATRVYLRAAEISEGK